MTDKIKRDARARAAATGESYTRARRAVARQPAAAADVPGNDAEMVSLATVRDPYGVWRWRIERDSSNRLVEAWAKIGASALPDDTTVRLANVAWAVAAFERAYDVLLADIVRAEQARNVGVPAVMALLTGPYQDSLDYLLGMSLWMDLGDVLVAYRTIAERLKRLKRLGERRIATLWSAADLDREVRALQDRKLPDLSSKPVTILANTILHDTWDPRVGLTVAFQLYWKGSDPLTLDFAEGDFLEALATLVDETVKRVIGFISGALERHAAANRVAHSLSPSPFPRMQPASSQRGTFSPHGAKCR
jgi:hypothetical protein